MAPQGPGSMSQRKRMPTAALPRTWRRRAVAIRKQRERHAQDLFVHAFRVLHVAVLAERFAVIAGDRDHGILQVALALELLQDLVDGGVGPQHAVVVVVDGTRSRPVL